MNIKEIMTPNVELISPDISLKEAAEKMKTLNVGILPVAENDRLIGMITDRDIVIRSTADGHDPNSEKVHEIMSHKVIYCYEDDSIQLAGRKMQDNQIRRLIVLNRDKRLVGICSLGDLAVASHDFQLAGEVLERVSES